MSSLNPQRIEGGSPQDERSIGELFRELADETGTLIRQEVKLATTEMTKKATHAALQVALLGVAAVLGAVSMLTLLGALVLVLGTMFALWKAALLVGVVAAIVAIAIAMKGLMALRRLDPVPRQTLESIREDKSWIQQQVR